MRHGSRIGLLVAVLSLAPASVHALPGAANTPVDALAADATTLARTLGIDAADAARQLGRQAEVAVLGVTAEASYPDEFAGIWIDPYAGGRVTLAFTDDAVGKAARLAPGFSRPDLVAPVTLARSWQDLTALQRRMIADREVARAGRLAFPGVSAARYDLDIDVRRNTIVVLTEHGDTRTADAFRSRYGDAVVVEANGIGGNDACTITDCRYSLRSGLKIASSTGGYCSSAFAGSSGMLFTAGHCGAATTYHGGSDFGAHWYGTQSGSVDAEALQVYENGFYPSAHVWVSTSEVARPITSSGTYAGLTVGASVCKTGATTGNSCGTVASKTFAPSWGGSNFIRSNTMCVQPGDSGAGVYSGNQATGIHSGSARDGNGNPYPCTDSNFFGYFGHIEFAVSTIGISVKTSEGFPSFLSVSGAAPSGTSFTATYSKPLRCSSVSASDWTVRTQGQIPHTVTSASCSADSDRTISFVVSPQFIPGTSVSVTQTGSVSDVGSNTVTGGSRTMTVPLT